MGFILEILFEFILEGSMEAVGEKKVPLLLRILAATVLILVFGGLVGLIVYMGVCEKSWFIIGLGIILAVFAIAAVWKTVRKHRK